ncbi:MAG: hypothetical protein EP335_05470 [Alphaproteobacteria bacterium]|nr:MAG: hypothetical protein EP335_05470 [Alphaproteobacteria bacterium]
MNLVAKNFSRSAPLNLGGAIDQLGFLLSQLNRARIESIVVRVERLANVSAGEDLVADPQDRMDIGYVQQALARILYAVAGMSYEDRLFALTYAEIQALLDGAEDDSFDTAYCQ